MPGKAQNDQPNSSENISYEQRRQHIHAMLRESAGTMPQRHLDLLGLSLVLNHIGCLKDTPRSILLRLLTHT